MKRRSVDVYGDIHSALFDMQYGLPRRPEVIEAALQALDEAYWRMCALESIEGHIRNESYIPKPEELVTPADSIEVLA